MKIVFAPLVVDSDCLLLLLVAADGGESMVNDCECGSCIVLGAGIGGMQEMKR